MRFGVSGGLFPNRIDEFTESHAARVRELGYTGIFTRFDRDDPFETTAAQCRRVRSILADYGLTMVQAIGHRPPLIHPNESIRQQGVKTLREAIRIAAALGSLSCHTLVRAASPSSARITPTGAAPGTRTAIIGIRFAANS